MNTLSVYVGLKTQGNSDSGVVNHFLYLHSGMSKKKKKSYSERNTENQQANKEGNTGLRMHA